MRKNPVKAIREARNLTLDALAETCDLNRQTLLRIEQGLYDDLPDRLLRFLVKYASDLLADYHDWRSEQRRASYGRLVTPYPFPNITSDHPFVRWRLVSNLNQTACCRAFCLPRSVVYKFETQPYLLSSVPQPILVALDDSGYSPIDQEGLIQDFRRFKKEMRSRAVNTG